MKRELIYAAVIGGVVGAVLVMAAGSIAPLGAQNEAADAEFGTITCSKLVVRRHGALVRATEIDKDGVWVRGKGARTAALRADGVVVFGEKGKGRAYVSVDEDGGAVHVQGKDGESAAYMAIAETGGTVAVFGKDNEESAQMLIKEYGGAVSVSGKDGGGGAYMSITEDGGDVRVDGKDGGGAARMAIDETGGAVAVFGKDDEESAQMLIKEYGGAVSVFGRGNPGSRAAMGVNEHGNGGVSTWDKNGYRLATLK